MTGKISKSVPVETKEQYAAELHKALDEMLAQNRRCIIVAFKYDTEPGIRVVSLNTAEETQYVLTDAVLSLKSMS